MPPERRSLGAINALSEDEFVATFGDIAEHSPWVARAAMALRPFADRPAMIAAFHRAIAEAGRAEKYALLRAHPDLAGKAALAGDLAFESVNEQTSAGLDRLTPEEFELFTRLNDDYRSRHGIPFILAVKGATKHQILDAFAVRMTNDPATEFATALEQVGRIIRFRLEDRVSE